MDSIRVLKLLDIANTLPHREDQNLEIRINSNFIL